MPPDWRKLGRGHSPRRDVTRWGSRRGLACKRSALVSERPSQRPFRVRLIRRRHSVRALPLHSQVRIEELQRGVADMVVPLGAIDARSIDAGLRTGVPSQVVALVDEISWSTCPDITSRRTCGMNFAANSEFSLGGACGVPRADDDVGRDCQLPELTWPRYPPAVQGFAPLNVMRTYPDPLFASNAVGRRLSRFGALSQVVSVSPSRP